MKRLTNKTIITFSVMTAIIAGAIFWSNQWLPSTEAHEKNRPAKREANPSGCSNHSLFGSFGYLAQGVILPGAPVPQGIPSGPYAAVGRIAFDGNGNFTSVNNDNFNGLLIPTAPNSGTYLVNQDCTGTVAVNGGVTYKFTIVDNGKEVLFMIAAPGTVITGSAKRQ